MDRVVNLAKRRGLVFPSSRDLRRVPLHLGLRAARRAAQAQREGRLVAFDGAAPRRRRRPRLRDPHGARRCGRRAATSRTFTDPLVDCRNCKERFRADHLPDVGRVPELRRQGHLHRGAQLQPDVQDARRPGGGRRVGRVPAARDRAGHLRQLQERADDDAQEAAVRHRADRQVVPQRDHARQLHLPHARVRADGDGVLRAARRRREVVRVLGRRSATAGTSTSASPRPCCASARTIPTSSRTTRSAPATSSSRTRGVGASSRASRTAPTSTSRSTPKFSGEDLTYFDQESERALPAVRDRARGRRRPRHARVPARRVPRGRGEGREAHGAALDRRLAPIKVAVLPLSQNEKLVPLAGEVAGTLRPHFMIDVDDAGAIGRRYRRQDEVGTPLCVTIDFDSLDDAAVTVRDRDTMEQERIPLDRLVADAPRPSRRRCERIDGRLLRAARRRRGRAGRRHPRRVPRQARPRSPATRRTRTPTRRRPRSRG